MPIRFLIVVRVFLEHLAYGQVRHTYSHNRMLPISRRKSNLNLDYVGVLKERRKRRETAIEKVREALNIGIDNQDRNFDPEVSK